MKIEFRCQNCKSPLSVDQEHVGKDIACPACNKKLTIPGNAKRLCVDFWGSDNIAEKMNEKQIEERAFCPFRIIMRAVHPGHDVVQNSFPTLVRCIEQYCRLWNPEKKDCCFVNWK